MRQNDLPYRIKQMVTTFNICEINYINKFVKLLEIVEPANFDDIEYAEQSIIENPEART